MSDDMRFFQESHSGWSAKPDTMGGYEIVDANGWSLATLAYDYRFTCNATNRFRASLFATAPDLYEYVKSSASNGCATATALIDKMQNGIASASPQSGEGQ